MIRVGWWDFFESTRDHYRSQTTQRYGSLTIVSELLTSLIPAKPGSRSMLILGGMGDDLSIGFTGPQFGR